MSGQRPGSYPSPTSAQVQSGVPFYGQSVTNSQDVPAMVQLSEELSRQLNNDMHNHQHDDNVMLAPQIAQLQQATDVHQQLAQDAMGHLDEHHDFDDIEDDDGSEGGTHKRKRQKMGDDKRQKNTRACDECRRKKVSAIPLLGLPVVLTFCLQ